MGASSAEPRGPGGARSSEKETLDTPPSDWDAEAELSIEILVHNGQVFEEPEYYERERPEQIATELRDLTEARRVRVSHIDPTLGAGTNGLAFLLQFLETGAAVITWAVAVKAISPRIRKAIGHLRRLSPAWEPPRDHLTFGGSSASPGRSGRYVLGTRSTLRGSSDWIVSLTRRNCGNPAVN